MGKWQAGSKINRILDGGRCFTDLMVGTWIDVVRHGPGSSHMLIFEAAAAN